MRADLTKVRQTLFNLLSNACKFTHNGTVSLAAAREAADGARLDHLPGERYRHRHDPRASQPALPGVLAGGCLHGAQVWRHRPRPGV